MDFSTHLTLSLLSLPFVLSVACGSAPSEPLPVGAALAPEKIYLATYPRGAGLEIVDVAAEEPRRWAAPDEAGDIGTRHAVDARGLLFGAAAVGRIDRFLPLFEGEDATSWTKTTTRPCPENARPARAVARPDSDALIVACRSEDAVFTYLEDGLEVPGCSDDDELIAAGAGGLLLCSRELVARDGARTPLLELERIVAARADRAGFLVAAGNRTVTLWRVSEGRSSERIGDLPDVPLGDLDLHRMPVFGRGAAVLDADGALYHRYIAQSRSGPAPAFPHEVYRLEVGAPAPVPVPLGPELEGFADSLILMTGP